jgi:large subunit ribosomal protein L10
MRAEKELINQEYLERLQASPYFVVVDYTGLKVGPMTELRKRLGGVGAEIHVVKSSIFRLAAMQAGIEDIRGSLGGQMAVVTGRGDVAATAKVIKTFHSEFDRPVLKFGYLDNERLDGSQLLTLADLPPLNELRAKLVGLLNTPATRLAQVIQAPGAQLARVIKAKVDKG